MTPRQALRDIQGFAKAYRIRFVRHASERMAQRGADREDVRRALMTATSCAASGERWKVSGVDVEGDELTVVCVLEDGVVVVTVF